MKNNFTLKASKPLTWNSIPKQGVLVLSGHRGQGKSALGWWLAQEQQKKSKKPKKIVITIKIELHILV